MSTRYKRRYFVDLGYQLPQLAVFLFSNVLVALLIAAFLSWFYLLAWDGSVAYNHNRFIPVYIVSIVVCVALAAAFFSLRRSREIAGMMKKLQLLLNEASHGRLPDGDVTFRKSDYFAPLAGPLNNCLDRLRQNGSVATMERESLLVELAEEARLLGVADETVRRLTSKLRERIEVR